MDRNIAACSDIFGIGYIPQEVSKKIKGKLITQNVFRIQDSLFVDFIVLLSWNLCLLEKIC